MGITPPVSEMFCVPGVAVSTPTPAEVVGPAEIGAFVGSFYLPWAFKWAYGPVVDVFASADETTKASAQPAEARRFAAFVRSPQGQAILRRHGFGTP